MQGKRRQRSLPQAELAAQPQLKQPHVARGDQEHAQTARGEPSVPLHDGEALLDDADYRSYESRPQTQGSQYLVRRPHRLHDEYAVPRPRLTR